GLVRRDLLVLDVDPRSPERGQYGFVQSVIREVAYGTLARRDRRARHLAAARFYETLDDQELAGILASHYVAAFEATAPGPEADAVAAQARVTLRGAAERAMALHAYEGAAALYRQALTVSEEGADRAALREQIAEAVALGGNIEMAKRELGDAIAWYRSEDRRVDVVRTMARLGAYELHEGSISEAIATLEAAAGELGEAYAEDEVFATLASELARAYFRNVDAARSLQWAERALVVGERLALPKVIAETLNNKGGALLDAGRLQEGLTLLRGAIRHAEAHGEIEAELRARNNLAFFDVEDPTGALEIGIVGLEKARRMGMRDWDRQLTQMVARIRVLDMGDLDWVLAQAAVYEGTDVPATYRGSNTGLLGIIAALRGRPADATALLDESSTTGREVTDPQIRYSHALDRAQVDAIWGLPGEANDRVLATVPEMSGNWLLIASKRIGQSALQLREPARLAAARSLLASQPHGPQHEALLSALDGALAALGGDLVAARRAFAGAADTVRSLGLRMDLAWILLGTVTQLGPDDPVGAAAAAEARALFEAMGTPALATLLDGIMAREGAARPDPSARPNAVEAPAAQA
ncbi:MAG: hypothetical protein ACRDF7_10020, partial [Candidatus Limnocylindrales bacterium]